MQRVSRLQGEGNCRRWSRRDPELHNICKNWSGHHRDPRQKRAWTNLFWKCGWAGDQDVADSSAERKSLQGSVIRKGEGIILNFANVWTCHLEGRSEEAISSLNILTGHKPFLGLKPKDTSKPFQIVIFLKGSWKLILLYYLQKYEGR